jgi:hypothetical protein
MAVRLSALRAGRPLPSGRFLVLISVRGRVDPRATVRLEGLGQLKNPMTSSRGYQAVSCWACSWGWRQCNPKKYLWISNGLHGNTTQKAVLFTATAMRTSSVTDIHIWSDSFVKHILYSDAVVLCTLMHTDWKWIRLAFYKWTFISAMKFSPALRHFKSPFSDYQWTKGSGLVANSKFSIQRQS